MHRAPALAHHDAVGCVADERVLERVARRLRRLAHDQRDATSASSERWTPPAPATSASRSLVKSRPMAAAISATSRAPPSRSRRASSDACSESGSAGSLTELRSAARRVASSSSTTALVSSSMYSGIPSERATMSATIRGDSEAFFATMCTSAAPIEGTSGVSVIRETCGSETHAGANSGRARTSSRTGSFATRATVRARGLARGLVDPLRVLEHDQRRTLAREPFEAGEQRLQREPSLGLRRERRDREAIAARDIDDLGEQTLVLYGRSGEQRVESVELRVARVLAPEPGRPLDLLRVRMERRALAMRRAEVAQHVPIGRRFEDRGGHPRLADTAFAGDERNATCASARAAPACEQLVACSSRPSIGASPASCCAS